MSLECWRRVPRTRPPRCMDRKERCLNFRQPDEVFKILHVRPSVFCRCRVTTDRKNRIIVLCFLDHYKMLLNTVLNSATARQFRDTIFKILHVRLYRISIILSRSVQNIRLIECYHNYGATLSQITKKLLNIYIALHSLCKFLQPLDRRVIVCKS